MRVRSWLRRRRKTLLIEAALARGLLLGGSWLLLLGFRGLPHLHGRWESFSLFLILWLGSLGLSLLLWPPRMDPLVEDRALGLGMALPTLLEQERREREGGATQLFTPLLRGWLEGRIPGPRSLGGPSERRQLRRWIGILLLLLVLLFWLILLPGGKGGDLPDRRPGTGLQGRVPGKRPSLTQLPPLPRRVPKKRGPKKEKDRGGKARKPKAKRPVGIQVEDKVVLPAFREGKGAGGRKAPRFARAPREETGEGLRGTGKKKGGSNDEKRRRAEWRDRLKRSLDRGKLRRFEAEWLRAWGRILEKGSRPEGGGRGGKGEGSGRKE